MVQFTTERLDELGIELPSVTGVPIGRLSGGQRQAVAVARASSWATNVLFMDEPTAALGVQQTEAVLELARRVAARGIGVVLITHIMPHVMAVADRLVVLRHGRKVADIPSDGVTTEELVRLIVGFDPAEDPKLCAAASERRRRDRTDVTGRRPPDGRPAQPPSALAGSARGRVGGSTPRSRGCSPRNIVLFVVLAV